MLVKEIMSADPVCCTPETPLREVAALMSDYDCGAIPIVKDEESRQPIGVITDRDIVCRAIAEGKDASALTATDVMSNSCVTVSPDADLQECCKVMEAYQVRRVLVVDENRGCCGIVSQADIAAAAPEEDVAEVVKEISQPNSGGEVFDEPLDMPLRRNR
jgi:CBS domain-containing protein